MPLTKHIDQAIDGDFELSEHCFIRNRMLLTADILPPSKTVAKQINGFHEFSMAEKQRMMPQLELFFKGAPTFSPEGLTEAQQSWFKEMDALTGDDARKGPIWLSRYCVNAEATLEVVARVFDPSLGATQQDDDKPAEEQSDPDAEVPGGAAHSISGSMAGSMAAPPRSPSRLGHGNHQARQHPTAQSMGQSAPVADSETTSASQWLWPGIVVIGSIVLMCLGMMLAKPAVMAEGLCTGSDYPEQCQLATQIVADQEVWDAMRNDARPLPDTGEMRENALAIAHSDCSLDGAINAGHNSLKAFNGEIAPVRSSELTELFPGVLLLDVEYPNADGPGNVRTACLLNNEPIPSSSQATQPLTIGSAVIPTSWPAEAYDNSTDKALELRSQQAFHPLFTFGSTLLFTTVGLFAAALLRMAVTTYNLTALSQAAIAMAIFEGFFELLLPLNGLLMFPFIVARKSLALGLTGAVVPGFKVDWSGGYMSVAGCVAVMVFVRFVLRWLMILTILGGSVV